MAPQERVRAPLDITVAIIGGGVGTSIALELCRRGCRVRLHDADPIACQHAVNALVAELHLHVAEGLLMPQDVDTVAGRCEAATEMKDAVHGADLVIETLAEDGDAKRSVFAQITSACDECGMSPADVTLASNTFTSTPSETVRGVAGEAWAERAVGLRFFAPFAFIDDVELTRPPDARTCDAAHGLLTQLRFRPWCRTPESRRLAITPANLALYVKRQREQCARDAAEVHARVVHHLPPPRPLFDFPWSRSAAT